MHVRLGNVLDHHRYVVVPCPDRFVVRRSNKSSILIDKRDRVDWPQVLVVLLCNLARIHVVLAATG